MEKPFTRNEAEANKIIALAKEKGKILTPFQSMFVTRYEQELKLTCLLIVATIPIS